jgi:hypothetical protein
MGSSAGKGRHLAISTRPPRPINLAMVDPCFHASSSRHPSVQVSQVTHGPCCGGAKLP